MAALTAPPAREDERPSQPAGRRDLTTWAAFVLLALFLLTQYGDIRRVPFINDDYIFLDKTRSASFGSLWEPKGLAFHWYRPWSRELHYWVLQKSFGAREAPFHVASFLLALLTLVGFFALARRVAGTSVAAIATAGWASLAAWAVPVVWVAGVQDLWMLLFSFLSLGAVTKGGTWLSAAFFLLALLSKESAAVLPPIAIAYEILVARRGARDAFRRTLPLWGVLVAWAAFHPLLGGRLWQPLEGAVPPAPRAALPDVLGRTLLLPWNLDAWPKPENGWGAPLAVGAIGALLLAALVLFGLRAARTRPAAAAPLRSIAAFGGVWALLGLAPLLMPGLGWHNYYALLGAAGAWLAIAAGLVRFPVAALALIAALALVRAGRATTPSLDWGSEWYQRRAASFIGVMRADLLHSVPSLPPHSRLYFIRVPSYVGFLAGDGPALRIWYGDSTLRAGFYPTYRLRPRGAPAGEDLFFRFDSAAGWVRVFPGPEDLREARLRNPRWEADHEMLAQTLARAEDWQGALREYEKLVASDSLRVDFAYNVAVCWEAIGDSARAGQWYARAASLPGADAEVRNASQLYARHLPIPRPRVKPPAPQPARPESAAAPAVPADSASSPSRP